ncbi:MAG: transketolase [Chloroflexota bacterium]|jgi:transketolase
MTTATKSPWVEEVERVANRIRLRVLEHVLRNNGGYLSQACSSAELFATLYTRVMDLGPSTAPMLPPRYQGVPGPDNPDYPRGGAYNGGIRPDKDQFIFSPAHYALILYATLIEVGRLAPEALDEFNVDGSTVEMIGHEHSPGVDTTTGSLAQGISQAGGFALARKLLGEGGRVWVLMSDGEFQEGEVWEALAAMAFYGLDNVGIYVDVNQQQCDGEVSTTMLTDPLPDRLAAFGARAISVDGHDVEALAAASAPVQDGKPLVVLANTDPTRCMNLLEQRRPKLHYVRFASADERAEYEAMYETLKGTIEWKS